MKVQEETLSELMSELEALRLKEGDRVRCLAAGASGYMTKPVSLRKLNEFIQLSLNGPRRSP